MKYIAIATCMVLLLSLNACSSPAQTVIPTFTTAPTTTPIPSSTPTLEDTPTTVSTPTATALPDGPCDNLLVPLGKGNQWAYRAPGAAGETLFSLSTPGIQPGPNTFAQVSYSDQRNNLTVTKPVTCKDGAIVDYPLFVLNMLFSDYLDKYISANQKSGVYAPDYRTLTRNNWILDWEAVYLTENDIVFKNPTGDAGLEMPANTLINIKSSMPGVREPVSVPAGNFPQALAITQDISFPVIFRGSDGGSGLGDSMYITMTQWYVPNIGLVRAEITSVTIRVTQSLPHFFYDLPIEGMLELVEFKPGN
jgi:hypothetical protein